MTILHKGHDNLVAVLSPDAYLVLDASNCIVLVTPERRITVTNVSNWCELLNYARTLAKIYDDDAAERARMEQLNARPEGRS